MKMLTLEAVDLSIKFQDRVLFKIPHLKITPKSAIYLTGPNGIGKSTLLKILAGLQRPNTGKLNLCTPSILERLAGFSGHSGVLYMHQNPYLFDTTVAENVGYGLVSFTNKEKQRKIMQALERLQMNHLAIQHISKLSGGERQKVAMARAWVRKPSLLLMDEASSNLDSHSISIQKTMIMELLSEGASIVMTSHSKNKLTSCCDKEWIIENHSLTQQ